MSTLRTILFCMLLSALPVMSQNLNAADNVVAPATFSPTNTMEYMRAVDAIRTKCIEGRRIICGRIVKVLPDGLVVDSGYTSLMRQPLDRNWLIPGTVEAQKEPNLVEKNEPDCICVGLVFVTDLPKSRRLKPKVLDYVVLPGFPAGEFTYKSVGPIQRTVRRFSNSLPIAVVFNRDAAGFQPPFRSAATNTSRK